MKIKASELETYHQEIVKIEQQIFFLQQKLMDRKNDYISNPLSGAERVKFSSAVTGLNRAKFELNNASSILWSIDYEMDLTDDD